MPEISYIVNTEKPYPNFIKEHRIFKSLSKIDKVFPSIGLPNFTKNIVVYSTEEAQRNAKSFVYGMHNEISNRISRAKGLLKNKLTESGRERNEKCNSIQSCINILSSFYESIQSKDIDTVSDNKVVISAPSDIFSGASIIPVFKKGEAFLKILGKINLMLSEIDPSWNINYENNIYYKEFSRLNIPHKEYKMVFSSTGPEGAWDIATASMRGISSCQTWTSAQSRGLIGSISSKYVAIVYVQGDTDYQPYGKQMLFRSMVRLVIHKTTGQPALFMDTMYPSYNPNVFRSIKEDLEKKSGLTVFSANVMGDSSHVLANYHILNEYSRTFLREGEYSYMDHQVPIQTGNYSILFQLKNDMLAQRYNFYLEKIEKIVANKREVYRMGVAEIKKYLASENKDDLKKPEIEHAFQDLKKGQYAFQNILNFFAHCDKNHSTSHRPAFYFLNEIFKVMGTTDKSFTSTRECDIWILKKLISNHDEIKSKSWEVIKNGSWMKSFSSSSKRFHETIIADLKKELLASCKGTK